MDDIIEPLGQVYIEVSRIDFEVQDELEKTLGLTYFPITEIYNSVTILVRL